MEKKKFNIIEEGRFLNDDKLNNVTGGGVICPLANTYKSCSSDHTFTQCSNIYNISECLSYLQCGVLYYKCSNFPHNYSACPGTQGYSVRY